MHRGVVCTHRSQSLRFKHLPTFKAARPQKGHVMDLTDKYLTRKQVCETLGISTSTLRRMVDAGDFPQPIQISERRQLFWDIDVFDWLQERDLDRMRAIRDEDKYDEYWDEGEDGDEE